MVGDGMREENNTCIVDEDGPVMNAGDIFHVVT